MRGDDVMITITHEAHIDKSQWLAFSWIPVNGKGHSLRTVTYYCLLIQFLVVDPANGNVTDDKF